MKTSGRITEIFGRITGVESCSRKNAAVWKMAEKRMTRYEWNEAKNIKCITSQFHELITPFPREWFEIRMERFEDIEVCVPKEAEKYLSKMYGDYMTLPPEELRVIRHNTEFIDLNESYKIYKGIYYCVQDGLGVSNG